MGNFEQKYSEKQIWNRSFDEDTNTIQVSDKNSIITEYADQDIDQGATLQYVGSSKMDGTWLVKKIDESTGTEIRFANVSNNATKTTYTAAWTDRVTLNYDLIENLTF